jgi:hypothetical protein
MNKLRKGRWWESSAIWGFVVLGLLSMAGVWRAQSKSLAGGGYRVMRGWRAQKFVTGD